MTAAGGVRPARRRFRPIALFADVAFRRIWIIGALNGIMRWLEILAVGVYVCNTTGSALQVALLTFVRMVPMVLFGAPVGVIAERINRKILLAIGLAVMMASSATLGVLMIVGAIELWHIALGAFLNGVVWTSEFPVRRNMLGEIAGMDRIGAAMGIDSATNNATRMLGPLTGGLVLQTVGLQGVYAIGAILFAIGTLVAVGLRYIPAAPSTRDRGMFANIIDGLSYVRTNRVLIGTFAVTITFNFFGFAYTSMVPVIGRETIGLGALFVGLLMSAEGLGAFLGALIIAFTSPRRHYTRIFFFGTLAFMTTTLIFSLSSTVAVAMPALLIGGFGVAGFSTMQSLIVFTATPPEERARTMGMLAVCIGTGPIGVLHVGFLADWLGAATAVSIIASEGVIALVVIFFALPELRRKSNFGG